MQILEEIDAVMETILGEVVIVLDQNPPSPPLQRGVGGISPSWKVCSGAKVHNPAVCAFDVRDLDEQSQPCTR